MSSTKIFNIHGVRLRVETEFPALAVGVAELLQRFPEANLGDGDGLRMTYRGGELTSGPLSGGVRAPGGELLFSSAWDNAIDLAGRLGMNLDIYRQNGHLILDYHQHGHLLIDKAKGILNGRLIGPIELHPALLTSFFFLLPLSELLASRGLHMIHAAALERKGRGVLIPGVSGSGKTTSCVALIRAGYRCLSDDKPFLREDGNGIEVLAFPERIDVTERTITFFPELGAAPPGVLKTGYRKRHFHPEALYPGSTASAVRPALILFPHISRESESRLEKLSKVRALEAILPHGLLVLDREPSERQFDLLTRLVERADCYRLSFGQNVLELPHLVDALLG